MDLMEKKVKTITLIIKVLIILGLFLIYPVLAVDPDINLVANPDFENGTTVPLNWTFVSTNENTPIWSYISHSGLRSIEINIPGTTDLNSGYPESDRISVKPFTTYTFSAWGKTQDANGTNLPTIILGELDKDKNLLRLNKLPVFNRGTNDWEEKILEFQTGPNTSYIYVYANIWGGYGTFWMDDVTLSLKTNMVANPGFESGTTAPLNWTFISLNGNTPIWSDIPHNGSKSVEINIPGNIDLISGYPESERISAEPFTAYIFSAWGKTQDANGTNLPTITFGELDADKNLLRLTNLPLFNRGTNDWEQKIMEFQTGPNTSYIYFYANIPGGYGTFWMDDVTLSLKTNMVVNPGFENGTTAPLNWTFVNQGGNTPIWSDISHNGSKSVEINIPGNIDLISGYPESEKISAEPFTNYTFSAWGKTQGTDGTNLPTITFGELDADKNLLRLTNHPLFNRGTNDWEQKIMEFQTGPNTSYIYFYANIWGGYGTFWMDDVSLMEAPISTPSTTPTPIAPTIPPTPSPIPSGSCYIIPGGVPSSMTQYVGKTVCENCGHHSPIPSTWKPCDPTPTPIPPGSATIAYFGDVEPSSSSDVAELTKDLNQVISLSPTGKVDAVFFMGDMTKDSGTFQLTLNALSASSLKNTPAYFVIGNHEYNSRSTTYPLIKNKYSSSVIPLNYFSSDTQKTTFSMNVGNIHVINMNEYWDNGNGAVSDVLYNWMSTDLSGTTNYKIVIGHDPLYPLKKHADNSLDANTASRNKLQSLFVSQNVGVFLGGHTHYSSVQNKDGVLHIATGVIGSGTSQGEDNFATITYTYTTPDKLMLAIKQENPTWSTPRIATYTISPTLTIPAPTPDTPGPTPAPTPDTPGPSPAPTPDTPGPTPAPTPDTPGPTPAPTPDTPGPTTAPTPDTPGPTTAPTPDTPGPTTAPTPDTPGPTPAPTPAPTPDTPGPTTTPTPDTPGPTTAPTPDTPGPTTAPTPDTPGPTTAPTPDTPGPTTAPTPDTPGPTPAPTPDTPIPTPAQTLFSFS